MTIVDPERDERGWAITDDARHDARSGQRLHVPERGLRPQRHRLRRPRHGARAVGSRARPHRQQRVERDHPHARQRVRRLRASTRSGTTCPRSCAPRSTSSTSSSTRTSTTASTARASRARRAPTSGRSAGSSTRSTSSTRAWRRAATSWATRITEADWRLFPTLAALRPGVRRALQVQPAPHDRLPAAVGLPARPLPAPRHRRRRSTWITSSGTTTARTRTLNPTRIVPVGPALDLAAPHGREHLAAQIGV